MTDRYTKVEIDTTVKLWDYLYNVKIPYALARSKEDIRMYGTHMSGVSDIDKSYGTDIISCMINVNQMVEYYKEGVPLRIPSKSDVKEIYDAISDHLYAWKERLRSGINIFDAPVEDLIELDKFANAIYEHAKYQFTPEILNSLTLNHMVGMSSINTTNIFKPEVNKYIAGKTGDGVMKINAEPEEEKMPERESLASYFERRLTGIRRF